MSYCPLIPPLFASLIIQLLFYAAIIFEMVLLPLYQSLYHDIGLQN